MKTTSASPLVVLLLTITTQLSAQRNIRVEAYNDDISYALDLRAVASVFGDARNLEDFERRLNDNDNGISNLDLNNDGYIDYLRVIETNEKNVHLVVIQAVLGQDFYQDVASIVVERTRRNQFYVQVIGDPFMYGYDYIIEPYFARVPYIVNWFWSPRYVRWYSPYYWDYYPRYYHYRNPVHIDIYLGHIHGRINYDHRYRYSSHRRNDDIVRIYAPVGRNDYGKRYPEKNFDKRHYNEGVRNSYELGSRRDENTRMNNSRENQSGRDENSRRSYDSNRNNNDNRSGSRSDVRTDQKKDEKQYNSGRTNNNERNNSYNRNQTPNNDNKDRNVKAERPVVKRENVETRNESRTKPSDASVRKPSETRSDQGRTRSTQENNSRR